ncbi:hypothetical protein EDD85DRAFT_975935 [Armillaria nabsnona]|nr:hypothetical protein EDD85DRAFT_975935 [Armillaria nabsnona]
MPMLRNLKLSLSISLKFPYTVTGRGEGYTKKLGRQIDERLSRLINLLILLEHSPDLSSPPLDRLLWPFQTVFRFAQSRPVDNKIIALTIAWKFGISITVNLSDERQFEMVTVVLSDAHFSNNIIVFTIVVGRYPGREKVQVISMYQDLDEQLLLTSDIVTFAKHTPHIFLGKVILLVLFDTIISITMSVIFLTLYLVHLSTLKYFNQVLKFKYQY